MDKYLLNKLKEVILSDKALSDCRSYADFQELLNRKPPFYYTKKETLVKEFVRQVVAQCDSTEKAADICGVSTETIKKARSGDRYPSKELWVKFGLILGFPEDYTAAYIDAYMKIAGYSLNPSYLTDVIYYHTMKTKLSINETYDLLVIHAGNAEAKKFMNRK